MNQRIYIFIKKLILSRNFYLCLLLLISIKIPFSLLFKVLDLDLYLFLFCGYYSALSYLFFTLVKDGKPSVRSVCISVAVGALTSLFLYYCKSNYLLDLNLSINMPLCVLGVLDKLPKIKILHDLKQNHPKLSLNRLSFSGFRNALNNLFLANKITQGGFSDSQSLDESSKSSILLSERADVGNSRGNQSTNKGISATNLNDEPVCNNKGSHDTMSINYLLNQHAVLAPILKRESEELLAYRMNNNIKVTTVTLSDLNIKSRSDKAKLIKEFAEAYLKRDKHDEDVKKFCEKVMTVHDQNSFSKAVVYSGDPVTAHRRINTTYNKVVNELENFRKEE